VSIIVRHPVRGALWGLLFGLGATLLLVGRAIIALGTITPVLVVLVATGLGTAFGWFTPPRRVSTPTSPGAQNSATTSDHDVAGPSSGPAGPGKHTTTEVRTVAPRFCARCGANRREGARFCGSCGTTFGRPAADPSGAARP
jgi:hypothetical protein